MLFWLKAGDGKPGVPFQQIYEENYKQMYHVAFGILKSPAEAENAVQEAFLALPEITEPIPAFVEGS